MEHKKVKYYEYQIYSALNPQLMVEYNAMFESGNISIGTEISPHMIYESFIIKDEIVAMKYKNLKERNEFILEAIETYLQAIELKKELEILYKILENYEKIRKLILSAYKYDKTTEFSKILEINAKIRELNINLDFLKAKYNNLMITLNYYAKIDSIEDIESIPKLKDYKLEETVDYNMLSYELKTIENSLKLSYIKLVPNVKPMVLIRKDNTYGFMIGFTINTFPLGEIKTRVKLKDAYRNYYSSSIEYIKLEIERTISEYKLSVSQYELYKSRRDELMTTLNISKLLGDISLVEYYYNLNEILNMEREINRLKYNAILSYYKLKFMF
ncbi:MAG: hypothetical protein RMJ38_00570 [candidate division WOR-3 bacterium]|nr:hypothetical protein [candidate division WOR-3 bacterium]MDW8149927.1 hypothetical protein [candidate division WOR-3 bacterium]